MVLPERVSQILSKESDFDVVQSVIDGDIGKFELLMRRYNNRLFRVARGLLNDHDEAMDVVQESWVAAYLSLGSFKGPDGFGSWVSRITHNNSLMRLRKQIRIEYQSEESLERSACQDDHTNEPIDEVAQRQIGLILERAIDNLPVKYRSVFVLRAVQQLNTIETADSLGLNESVVKQRYLRAKRMLQDSLVNQIEKSGVTIWEFAGERCDRIVNTVYASIRQHRNGAACGRI